MGVISAGEDIGGKPGATGERSCGISFENTTRVATS
jgi:hypothetical protein